MWPFSRKRREDERDHVVKRFVAGVIIGGAIASIIGKHLLEQHEHEDDERRKK